MGLVNVGLAVRARHEDIVARTVGEVVDAAVSGRSTTSCRPSASRSRGAIPRVDHDRRPPGLERFGKSIGRGRCGRLLVRCGWTIGSTLLEEVESMEHQIVDLGGEGRARAEKSKNVP